MNLRPSGDYRLASDVSGDAPGGLVVFGIVGIVWGINEIAEAISGH